MERDDRSIGLRLKSVNNMIRRKIDSAFAEEGINEISGMQVPMIGYIYEHSREHDARLKKIVLTKKAIEQNNVVRRRIEEFNRYLEEGITPEEKEDFFHILDKITQNLQ